MEQNNKEKQFTSLIEEYKRVIYKICYMYATDGDNFKDLYQDVVINLWKGFEGYEGKGKPSSWIYRVGLNTCISFYRQQQRRGEHTSLDSLYGLEAEDSETTKRLKEMLRDWISLNVPSSCCGWMKILTKRLRKLSACRAIP